MKRIKIALKEGRFKIYGLFQEIGPDILYSIWGGTRPHIGAVGIAVPRASLKDPLKWSATSSNYTFVGHKEDMLVKELSELVSARLQKQVILTAGIHWDHINTSEIKIVGDMARKMTSQLLNKLQNQTKRCPPLTKVEEPKLKKNRK